MVWAQMKQSLLLQLIVKVYLEEYIRPGFKLINPLILLDKGLISHLNACRAYQAQYSTLTFTEKLYSEEIKGSFSPEILQDETQSNLLDNLQ